VIRIAVGKQQKDTVVAIDGDLVASELGELRRVRGSISGGVILHLENVISADAESLAELRDWIQDGALTRGASPYIQMMLEGTSGSENSEGKQDQA
jgi:hypothetical protein